MRKQKILQGLAFFIVIVLITLAIWTGPAASIMINGKINLYEQWKKIDSVKSLPTSKLLPNINSTRNITPTASKISTTLVTRTPTKKPSITLTSAKKSNNITITATGFAFDQKSVTVPAGSQVFIMFKNQDVGIPHNVAIYTDSTLKNQIFKGEIITGPDQITYPSFKAPDKPGVYFFRCDVHPMMNGQFIVK